MALLNFRFFILQTYNKNYTHPSPYHIPYSLKIDASAVCFSNVLSVSSFSFKMIFAYIHVELFGGRDNGSSFKCRKFSLMDITSASISSRFSRYSSLVSIPSRYASFLHVVSGWQVYQATVHIVQHRYQTVLRPFLLCR